MTTNAFKVDVKVGILKTIANAIYGSTEIKIREAVANSFDNDAKSFIIYLDSTGSKLSLFDNGRGISKEVFEQIFTSIGYGLHKNEEGALSYFGLGLMSVFRLGTKADIFTRTKGDVLQKLSVDVNAIFSDENEDKPISFLGEQGIIKVEPCDISERNASSPLNMMHVKKCCGEVPEHFTEIVIELKNEDAIFINSSDFIPNISKYLPLKANPKHSFLTGLPNGEDEKILSILNDEYYCRNLDVYYGKEDNFEPYRLYKYFPDFNNERLQEVVVKTGISKDRSFAYYFIIGTADLEEQIEKENAETGFWVRNKNFLVQPAENLVKPRAKNKIVHQPLIKWFYCEIFHVDMNDFLTVSRNEYLWDNPNFKIFQDAVREIVQPINKKIREAWEKKGEITTYFIEPFKDIAESSGPLGRVENKIEKMGIDCHGEEAKRILKDLHELRKEEIENDKLSIENLLNKGGDILDLSNQGDMVSICIDRSVDKDKLYYTKWDHEADKLRMHVSPSIFANRDVAFLGEKFKVVFVAANEKSAFISINNESRKIYINPFNANALTFTISAVDIYIAIEVADSQTDTKAEMKPLLLKLLGLKDVDVKQYLGPLSKGLEKRQYSKF